MHRDYDNGSILDRIQRTGCSSGKDDKPVIFSKRFFNNKYLIGAFVLGTVLITGVLTIPGLHAMFKVVTLNMTQLMTVYGLAFLNLPVIQGLKYLKGKTKWN